MPNSKKLPGGDGGIRTHVLLSLPIKDYMLRSGFVVPSEIFDSFFFHRYQQLWGVHSKPAEHQTLPPFLLR